MEESFWDINKRQLWEYICILVTGKAESGCWSPVKDTGRQHPHSAWCQHWTVLSFSAKLETWRSLSEHRASHTFLALGAKCRPASPQVGRPRSSSTNLSLEGKKKQFQACLQLLKEVEFRFHLIVECILFFFLTTVGTTWSTVQKRTGDGHLLVAWSQPDRSYLVPALTRVYWAVMC